VRLLLALALLALATDAHARCIDHRGRPCRLRVTAASLDYLRAPDLAELRGVLLHVDLANDDETRTGWGLECIRVDLVDFASADALPSFAVRGYGLGARYTVDHPTWGAWLGVHIATVWNDAVRYLTPSLGVRAGEHTVATVELRSAALYVGSAGDTGGRSLARDFDLDARLALPGGLAWRGRYRDIDTGADHVRDAFLALGFEVSLAGRYVRTMPSFVGVGIRRTLARTTARDDNIAARTVTRPQSGWQLLAWFEIDLGMEQRGR
jgi:hypothetical protein